MGGMIVLAMTIGIIVIIGQTIKERIDEKMERSRDKNQAFLIHCNFPHILRNRLMKMYLHVNETIDSSGVIKGKVENNQAVNYFLTSLAGIHSKEDFMRIWKEITDYEFLPEPDWSIPRHIDLSTLEYDMKYDNQIQNQIAIGESQKKKQLRDKYGEWF
jgi:hypothetical protein